MDKTIIAEDIGVLSGTIYKNIDSPGCHRLAVNATGAIVTTPVDCNTGTPTEEVVLLEQLEQNRGYRITSEPAENQPAFAETFILPSGGRLTKINIPLCVNATVPVKIHFYKITTTNTFPDFPAGGSLATYTTFPIHCAGNTAFPRSLDTVVDISNSPLSIAADTPFAMVIESAEANFAAFDAGSSIDPTHDAYPNGRLMLFKNNVWGFINSTPNDMTFRIVGKPF